MTGTSVGEMANENHQQEKRSHCCISHEFFDAATKHPDKIAVIHASGWAAKISSDPGYASPPSPGLSLSCTPPVYGGDKCFSFAEVLSSVDSLSSRLRRILDGGGDDDAYLIKPRFRDELYSHVGGRDISFGSDVYMPKVLGIYMPPSVEYIISVLSVMRCGEAFLPLDPSWPRDRILSIISSSNASLVIACGSSFNEVGCQPLETSHWLVESSSSPVLLFSKKEDSSEESDCSSFLWPCKKERCRAFCYLMYTSGSTGKPKGVCGTEQGLLNRFLWMQEMFPVVGEEHLAFKTSIGFVDHLQEFLAAILTSTPLVIPPFTIMRKNMFSILYFLEAYTISRLISVPSMIKAILPTLQSYGLMKLRNSLKLIVLSGEDFPISLWDMLHKLLPDTCILNLYGSTEVSGDCTYFDCRRLPKILKTEKIASVPIGLPISNCEVVVIPDRDNPYEGEICVGGFCLSSGYLHTWTLSQDYVKLHGNSVCDHVTDGCGSRLYFRTGDYGRKLPSGDLVFLGRRDRTIKLNGQRIALEEIERSLELHPSVVEAVVLLNRDQKELASLEAFLVIKKEDGSDDNIIYSIRNWLVERLPSLMIPKYFVLMESMPVSLSGKVDYKALASLRCPRTCARDTLNGNEIEDLMQAIRKAFCDALGVKEVSDDDDFFAMGGDSLAAAHLSHSLGINMRLLYEFSCPSKLCNHLLEKKGFPREGATDNVSLISDHKKESQNGTELIDCNISVDLLGDAPNTSPLSLHYEKNISPKRLKVDSVKYEYEKKKDRNIWNSIFANMECSFTRCNKMSYVNACNSDDASQRHWSVEFPKDMMISMQELWKVHMDSCVDASPLIVFKSSNIYLFIGSHSHKFLCIDAKS